MQEQHQFLPRRGNQLRWSWNRKATEPTQKGLSGLQVPLKRNTPKVPFVAKTCCHLPCMSAWLPAPLSSFLKPQCRFTDLICLKPEILAQLNPRDRASAAVRQNCLTSTENHRQSGGWRLGDRNHLRIRALERFNSFSTHKTPNHNIWNVTRHQLFPENF